MCLHNITQSPTPMLVAQLKKITVQNLCFNKIFSILSVFFSKDVLEPDEDGLCYASLSCPALIMSILQYCPDCKQHAQFVETLMRFKSDVCLDILAVLAYGPQPIINSAGQVLLYYYPLKDVGKAYGNDWNVFQVLIPQNFEGQLFVVSLRLEIC